MIARKHGNTQMYEVFMDNGGRVPDDLVGLYTSPRFANEAISQYQNALHKRVVANTPKRRAKNATKSKTV